MKKILFLDDSLARQRTVKPYFHQDEAYTSFEAIQLLKVKRYDIVCLDHDLGGKTFVNSFGEEETGYTVAKWIAENKPEIPLIIVHSLNPAGSNNIQSLLKSCGYTVLECGFLKMAKMLREIVELDLCSAEHEFEGKTDENYSKDGKQEDDRA